MKRQHPTLYSILSTFEARAIGDLGLPPPELDVLDDAKLKLCDRFDAYLWARLHRPDYVGSSAHWIAHLAWLRKAADALGVRPKFEEVLRGAL